MSISLFQRLGGADAISAVVDKFYEIMLKDSRVSHYFASTDMQKQRCRQKQFITLVTGGPNIYEGTDMKTAHCKLSIGHMEYDATWENLQRALRFFNVPKDEINQFKQIFYSVQSQIVNKANQIHLDKNLQGLAQETQEQAGKCLYERLGGHNAVSSVVNKFYQIMLKDSRVNFYFANTDMNKQRESQTEFISMVTGGSNNYHGKDMKTALCPFQITHSELNVTWENLEKALRYFNVVEKLIRELKDIFYSVDEDIVRQTTQYETKTVQKNAFRQNSVSSSPSRLAVQIVIPVTSKSEAKSSPHSKYEDKSVMQCPHMSSKLKQNFQTVHKPSQQEKRILKRQVMSKQIEQKEVRKLSNCPYQRIYY